MTQAAAVTLVDDLKRDLDRGSASLLVLLDLLGLHHHQLRCPSALLDLGWNGTLLQWIHSFLSDRSQTVVAGDCVQALGL